MVDPVIALSAAGIFVIVLGFIFYPKKGLFARWRQYRTMSERILIEDALKHFQDFEYLNRDVSIESLSGAISIHVDEAAKLLSRLVDLKLLHSVDGQFQLTAEGRRYALRIIRMHRLWERYLADNTGYDQSTWHAEADRREHFITPEEAESLARAMDNPRFDPHGDPIPTASGDVPPHRWIPLTDLGEKETGVILHIEDEPDVVYGQLIAEGFQLGMKVYVTERSPNRISFLADGEERVLTTVMAANVGVQPIQPVTNDTAVKRSDTLVSLAPGEQATVLKISPACRSMERRRMMDLGIVAGTAIEIDMQSPLGDPTAYRIRGTSIALRKEQAQNILISKGQQNIS